MRYKVAYPNNFDKSKKYPIIFYMHGAGERGDNLDIIDTHGVFREINGGKEFDFICVAPQCESDLVWYEKLPEVKAQVWAFYGLNDKTVYVNESLNMVHAINATGGKAKLTILEHAEHNCWTEILVLKK